ncbi:MAG: hypothetical protein ACRC1H_04595 [Caldilineaceae bacterium]
MLNLPIPPAQVSEELGAFTAELEQVGDLLLASLDGLYPPLSSMARAAVRAAAPLRRGALVLAVAMGDGVDAGMETLPPDLLRERRIVLAAALEMLAVALGIHATLLGQDTTKADHSLDKSIVGSTILTGDYCFSRAAWLAAQTESPVVVDLFAQALKTVSEGMLRAQMQPGGEPDVTSPAPSAASADDELVLASVQAAAHLANLSNAAAEVAVGLAPCFGAAAQTPPVQNLAATLAVVSPPQSARWQAALAWLAAQPSLASTQS